MSVLRYEIDIYNKSVTLPLLIMSFTSFTSVYVCLASVSKIIGGLLKFLHIIRFSSLYSLPGGPSLWALLVSALSDCSGNLNSFQCSHGR